jgi:hypothetical protein
VTVPDSTQTTDALEAALGPDLRFALRTAIELLEVPPVWRDRWVEVPELRLFQSLAVQRRARELRGRGASKEAALGKAAMELGLSPETLRSRLKRSLRHAARRS